MAQKQVKPGLTHAELLKPLFCKAYTRSVWETRRQPMGFAQERAYREPPSRPIGARPDAAGGGLRHCRADVCHSYRRTQTPGPDYGR